MVFHQLHQMKLPESMSVLKWTQLEIISRTELLSGLKSFAVCEL